MTSTNEQRDRNAVAIDYETFYDTKSGYSLTDMSPQNYCADKRFDPYLVALCGFDLWSEDDLPYDSRTIVLEDGRTARVPMCDNSCEGLYGMLPDGRQTYVGRISDFYYWSNLSGRILIAHNAGFDSVVFDECAKRNYSSVDAKDVEWQCTADLTAYLGVQRNLKAAMKYLFGKEISKEVRSAMDGKHFYDLEEDEIAAVLEYGCSDAIECHDIWLKYSSQWPEVERRISSQNRNAIARGVLVDRKYAEESLKELKSYQAQVVCDIPWCTQINPKTREFYKVGSLPALRQAVLDLGISDLPKSFKKDDPGFLAWLECHDDIPFIKARQKAVAISMHSSRIEGILDSLDSEGKSHPSFLYFGAHTGRFSGKSSSGGSNVNMLNMPRKPVLSGDEHVFGGKGVDIRGMYIPRPGYKFVVFDYSQIEARFSLWLVDDTHMMDALKVEGNLYQANAVAMGWCASKSDIKHTDPDTYRLAKCCLAGDSLVLVRSEKDGVLTSPYYKPIMQITTSDKVWDGSQWVGHLGVSLMKEVHENELSYIGGVWATDDHKVYSGEHEVDQLGDLLDEDKAAAVSWGQSTNPVQGWAHVRILAAALSRLAAGTVCLAARKAVRVLAGKMSLHGVRKGDDPGVAQREKRTVNKMQILRPEAGIEDTHVERVGEGAR